MIINMSKPENSEINKESFESGSIDYITSDEGVSEDKSLKQSTNLEIESLECQGYSDKQEPWVRVCLCEKRYFFQDSWPRNAPAPNAARLANFYLFLQ